MFEAGTSPISVNWPPAISRDPLPSSKTASALTLSTTAEPVPPAGEDHPAAVQTAMWLTVVDPALVNAPPTTSAGAPELTKAQSADALVPGSLPVRPSWRSLQAPP